MTYGFAVGKNILCHRSIKLLPLVLLYVGILPFSSKFQVISFFLFAFSRDSFIPPRPDQVHDEHVLLECGIPAAKYLISRALDLDPGRACSLVSDAIGTQAPIGAWWASIDCEGRVCVACLGKRRESSNSGSWLGPASVEFWPMAGL